MIDIHCHVLYDADDGPDSLESSVEMCALAAGEGIEKIIATPHYIIGTRNELAAREKVDALNRELRRKGVAVEVLPGNEAFIDFCLVDRLESGDCLPLNGSRYVLLELPMLEVPKFTEDVVYEIQLKGYIPVIAHPERNRVMSDKPDIVYNLVKNGCLMQVNSTSLMGMEGERAAHKARELLNHKLVHFVATDAHSAGRRRPVMAGVRPVLEEACGAQEAQRILFENPEALVGNREIEVPEPVSFKAERRLWRFC